MSNISPRGTIFSNSHELYSEFLKKKGLKKVTQYATAQFSRPTISELSELNIIDYAWQRGDRFYKIAAHVYGDMRLWWVIPWFNQIPLEADYEFGQIIHIPLPIERVLSMV